MRIQIASFALVPDHIFIAEREFHADKIILVLSDENKDLNDENNEEVRLKVKEVTEFYQKLNIETEVIYVNFKQFLDMTIILAKLINQFTKDDKILLNLSGGRRSIPIALIYAGTFISNFKEINIKCVVIPEDKTYKPFDLLPNYLPDDIDIELLSKIPEILTLTNLEEYLGIKQPTISMRVKRLEKNGYLFVNGRKRELTELGKMIVNIGL